MRVTFCVYFFGASKEATLYVIHWETVRSYSICVLPPSHLHLRIWGTPAGRNPIVYAQALCNEDTVYLQTL